MAKTHKAARAAFHKQIKTAATDGTFPSAVMENGYMRCKYLFVDDAGKEHRCMAGLLLEDGDPIAEGESVDGQTMLLIFEAKVKRLGISRTDLYMLQSIHDKWAKQNTWDAEGFLKEVEETGILNAN